MGKTDLVPDINPETNTITCTAQSRQQGRRCRRSPSKGRRQCKLHGGATLVGVANPSFKNGRHSQYMPARMIDDLKLANADPDLHSLRSEITIIDARISDMMKRVDTGESGHLWVLLSEAQREVDRLERAGSKFDAELYAARAELRSLIIDGHDDVLMWKEIFDAIERRKRLLEAERKRLVEMKKSVDTDRVLALFTALMNIVKARVEDPRELAAIANDASRLLNAPEYQT